RLSTAASSLGISHGIVPRIVSSTSALDDRRSAFLDRCVDLGLVRRKSRNGS
ncbi:MAG: hypothetical protein ACI8WY_003848, partial [Planctomycetota bacterium]